MYANFRTCPSRDRVSPSPTLPSYALACECGGEPPWDTRTRVTPQEEQSQQNGGNPGPWTRRAELSSQSRLPSLNCYRRKEKCLPYRSHCYSAWSHTPSLSPNATQPDPHLAPQFKHSDFVLRVLHGPNV